MRILQLGRFNFNQVKGGVQYFADRLAYHLSLGDTYPVQIDEVVTGSGPESSELSEPKRHLVTVGQFGEMSSVPFSPGILFQTWKLLLKNKYDIVHLNFPDPWQLLAFLFVPKRFKIVVTWHADIIKQKKLLKFYQPFLKFFMKRVDHIIVSTSFHLHSCPQLSELKMDDKISVVPFGVEPADWKLTPAVSERALALKAQAQGKMLIFAFGRHVYYKGFAFLIEAMKQLPDCYLLLGGSGPLTEDLKQQVQNLNLGKQVQMVGQISVADLPAYFYASDVFAFPSVDKTETFGYAQVEAMMCGLPVVSTWLNNGVNFVNIDQETGFVVPPRDANALAKALERLRGNPDLRKQLAQKAKTRSFELFTAEKTAANVYQVFKKLL